MGWLSKVTTKEVYRPPRTLFYGEEGIGKTTWAAGAEGCIFLSNEAGLGHLSVPRLVPANWRELWGQLQELATENHPYKVVVLDTLDSLNRLAEREVLAKWKAATLERVGGGFGKGNKELAALWRQLIEGPLTALWARGIHLVVLAHSKVSTAKNPDGADYDRYGLLVPDAVAALWKGWVDVLLFGGFEVINTARMETEKGKAKTGARRIRTTKSVVADAKNRLSLPATLEMEWNDFASRLPKTADEEAATLRAKLIAAVEEGPEEEREKRLAWLQGANLASLRVALGKIEAAAADAEAQAADEADDYSSGGGE